MVYKILDYTGCQQHNKYIHITDVPQVHWQRDNKAVIVKQSKLRRWPNFPGVLILIDYYCVAWAGKRKKPSVQPSEKELLIDNSSQR